MIRWEREGAIATVTLDRPDRRNALTAGACHALADQLADAPGVRAVVITGAQDAFCAGADLAARLDDADAGEPDGFRPAFAALTTAMATAESLVIAAVHGPALGAGTQLVAWSDLRVADDTAEFGIPAGLLGVHVSGPSIGRLIDIVGMSAAEQLLLTSRTIDADEAHRIGLVQFRAADALDEAWRLAEELVAHAPQTLVGHKRALRAFGARMSPEDATDVVRREQQAFASRDVREGLAARRERRPPRFTGS